MTGAGDGCGCKVGRGIETYGLAGVNDELAARRTGESGRPDSLRTLADYFNRAVLRSAMEEAGETPLAGEVENTYRLLTDDDVSTSMRLRARAGLERDGVDVDGVEGHFVSHPTMGAHLEECLGVEKPRDDANRVEAASERIFKLQSRAEAVTEQALDGLVSAGRITGTELTVTVDVQVGCEACGVYADVGSFVERGGCDCGCD